MSTPRFHDTIFGGGYRYLVRMRVCFVLGLILTFLFPGWGYSQQADVAAYPNRPINWIIGLPPGGPSDLAMRLMATKAEKYLGQQIIPINKPGAGMTIGIATVAAAKPDGYTVGYISGGPMFLVPYFEKLPYHPVKDLKPIMQFGGYNMGVMVRGDASYKNFREIIEYARQNPGKLTCGTAGNNTTGGVIMQMINKEENVKITLIPFKGSPESQVALMGGHVDLAAGDFNYSLLEAKKIRVVLLLREDKSVEYPELPTLKDLGYNFPAPFMIAIAGPKGIPDGIVKKLEDALTKAMKEPDFIQGMKDLRLPITYRSSKQLGDYVTSSYDFYGKLLKDLGLIK